MDSRVACAFTAVAASKLDNKTDCVIVDLDFDILALGVSTQCVMDKNRPLWLTKDGWCGRFKLKVGSGS